MPPLHCCHHSPLYHYFVKPFKVSSYVYIYASVCIVWWWFDDVAAPNADLLRASLDGMVSLAPLDTRLDYALLAVGLSLVCITTTTTTLSSLLSCITQESITDAIQIRANDISVLACDLVAIAARDLEPNEPHDSTRLTLPHLLDGGVLHAVIGATMSSDEVLAGRAALALAAVRRCGGGGGGGWRVLCVVLCCLVFARRIDAHLALAIAAQRCTTSSQRYHCCQLSNTLLLKNNVFSSIQLSIIKQMHLLNVFVGLFPILRATSIKYAFVWFFFKKNYFYYYH